MLFSAEKSDFSMSMKNRINAVLVGLALFLATTSASQAMSKLVSLTIEPLWPASTEPGTIVLYQVTVTREGQGFLEVNLSADGLPEGAVVSFSANPLRFVGREPGTQTCIMAIDCAQVTATDTYAFTVTGKSRRETITVANLVSKAFSDVSSNPSLTLDLRDDGTGLLRGTGVGGQTYRIETSTDLLSGAWATLGFTTADGNGRFMLIDEDTKVADLPMKFYRAIALPPGETGISDQ
jgi:hypothetical protein